MNPAKKTLFPGIVGSSNQLRALASQIRSRKFSHAYLFIGPQGVGKRRVAYSLIQYLLGLGERQAALKHPDALILNPENEIKIDQVRGLKRFLHLKPYQANCRVACLFRVERMTQAAANALLKVLEEPRGNSVLILTTTARQLLLPTIVSRCQLFTFQRTPHIEIQAFLEKKGIESEQAKHITHLSEGVPGRAVRYVQSPDILKEEQRLERDLFFLKRKAVALRFQFAHKFIRGKRDLNLLLKVWSRTLRDILMFQLGCPSCVQNKAISKELAHAEKDFRLINVLTLLKLLGSLAHNLHFNINRRLALEVILLNI